MFMHIVRIYRQHLINSLTSVPISHDALRMNPTEEKLV